MILVSFYKEMKRNLGLLLIRSLHLLKWQKENFLLFWKDQPSALPMIRSCFPSPLKSPASIVNTFSKLISFGGPKGVKRRLPSFLKFKVCLLNIMN